MAAEVARASVRASFVIWLCMGDMMSLRRAFDVKRSERRVGRVNSRQYRVALKPKPGELLLRVPWRRVHLPSMVEEQKFITQLGAK